MTENRTCDNETSIDLGLQSIRAQATHGEEHVEAVLENGTGSRTLSGSILPHLSPSCPCIAFFSSRSFPESPGAPTLQLETSARGGRRVLRRVEGKDVSRTTTEPFRLFPVGRTVPFLEVVEEHLCSNDGIGDTSRDESNEGHEDPPLGTVPEVLDESSQALSLFQATQTTETEGMLDRVVNPICVDKFVASVRMSLTGGEVGARS